MIDGTYGFVYSGVNGLGVGVFTILGEKFEGVDFVGGRYTGTAHKNSDGTISISIDFDVKPGIALVQGTAAQQLPYRRHIEHEMPAGFGNGRPVEMPVPPGSVTVMVKRVHRHRDRRAPHESRHDPQARQHRRAIIAAGTLFWPQAFCAQRSVLHRSSFRLLFQVTGFLKHVVLCKRLLAIVMLKVWLTPYSRRLAHCTCNMPRFVYPKVSVQGSLWT